MQRALLGALAELGLSATEAEIYVALLRQGSAVPVSAYKLAQDMGRDPANMTKTLAAMAKRGAVRTSGQRPRRYAPVAPEDFTGDLVARIRARQQQALTLLREIGQTAPDASLRHLDSRAEAIALAQRLVADAAEVVLVDAAAELLTDLQDALTAAADRGATVLVRSTAAVPIARVQVWTDEGADAQLGAAPGPWLRLAVDGAACLEMLAHPQVDDRLLHGHWSRGPVHAFMTHRSLTSELILADTHELLHGGATGELARRRAGERAALLLRLVRWRERWREAGLPDYTPAAVAGAQAEIDPAIVAETLAELAAEGSAEDPGPLQFLFRRRRKKE